MSAFEMIFQFKKSFLYFFSKKEPSSKNGLDQSACLISCFLSGEPVELIRTKTSFEATLRPKISVKSPSYSIIGIGYSQNFSRMFSYSLLTFFVLLWRKCL